MRNTKKWLRRLIVFLIPLILTTLPAHAIDQSSNTDIAQKNPVIFYILIGLAGAVFMLLIIWVIASLRPVKDGMYAIVLDIGGKQKAVIAGRVRGSIQNHPKRPWFDENYPLWYQIPVEANTKGEYTWGDMGYERKAGSVMSKKLEKATYHKKTPWLEKHFGLQFHPALLTRLANLPYWQKIWIDIDELEAYQQQGWEKTGQKSQFENKCEIKRKVETKYRDLVFQQDYHYLNGQLGKTLASVSIDYSAQTVVRDPIGIYTRTDDITDESESILSAAMLDLLGVWDLTSIQEQKHNEEGSAFLLRMEKTENVSVPKYGFSLTTFLFEDWEPANQRTADMIEKNNEVYEQTQATELVKMKKETQEAQLELEEVNVKIAEKKGEAAGKEKATTIAIVAKAEAGAILEIGEATALVMHEVGKAPAHPNVVANANAVGELKGLTNSTVVLQSPLKESEDNIQQVMNVVNRAKNGGSNDN